MGVFNYVITSIVFVQIALSLIGTNLSVLSTQINDAKQAKEFTSLLKNIVDTNKERMDTLKKMTRLQEFPPYPPRLNRKVLETSEENDSNDSSDSRDEEGPDIVAYLVMTQKQQILRAAPASQNPPNAPKPIKNKTNSNEMELNIDKYALRKDKINLLRESLRSCNSRKIKKCKRACKTAISNACSTYSCKKRLKRNLKKECKKACKEQFKRDDDDYNDDDDW